MLQDSRRAALRQKSRSFNPLYRVPFHCCFLLSPVKRNLQSSSFLISSMMDAFMNKQLYAVQGLNLNCSLKSNYQKHPWWGTYKGKGLPILDIAGALQAFWSEMSILFAIPYLYNLLYTWKKVKKWKSFTFSCLLLYKFVILYEGTI